MGRCLLAVVIVGYFALVSPANAVETRVALVIGNSGYEDAPLANPVNDARLMAETLRGLGFDVIERTDADSREMKLAIFELGDRLEVAGTDAVGLFYYAGHGVQVNGQNYLIPLGAEITKERHVAVEAVSAGWVLGQMEFSQNRVNFIILDACRNNPLTRGFRSRVGGLAKMNAPTGSLVAYSTGPGDVAADGTGINSPYTLALVRVMKMPGVPAEKMFKLVRNSVMEVTNGEQTPWEESSMTGEDFFFTGELSVTVETPTAVASSFDERQMELLFWQSIKDANEVEMFKAYLEQYQEGTFAVLARLSIKQLENQQAAAEAQLADEAQVAAEEEARSLAEIKRVAAEEEAQRQAEAEEEVRRLAEEETQRLAEEGTLPELQSTQVAALAPQDQSMEPYEISLSILPQVGGELSNRKIDRALKRYYHDKIMGGGLWQIENIHSMVVSWRTEYTISLSVRVTLLSSDHWNRTKGGALEVELEKFGSQYSISNVSLTADEGRRRLAEERAKRLAEEGTLPELQSTQVAALAPQDQAVPTQWQTADELHALLIGNGSRIAGKASDGTRVSASFDADGTINGKWGVSKYRGTWSFKGDLMCFDFRGSMFDYCNYIAILGDKSLWWTEDGERAADTFHTYIAP